MGAIIGGHGYTLAMSDSVMPIPSLPPSASPLPAPARSAASPVLLALDTATERLHVALVQGGATSARELPGGPQASAQLLPALSALLGEAGLAWADVDAVAFGSGPGAFTGLRTACSVTQGLALGLDLPVIPLDTLMAVAEDARQGAAPEALAGRTLWVLQDARMDELYVAAFTWDGERWHTAEGPALWPVSEPLRRWAATEADAVSGPRLCGNALLQCAAAFDGLPEGLALPGGAQAMPAGQALAALAQRAWADGMAVDAALALPRYVRDKVAQTTQERTQSRAAERATAP